MQALVDVCNGATLLKRAFAFKIDRHVLAADSPMDIRNCRLPAVRELDAVGIVREKGCDRHLKTSIPSPHISYAKKVNPDLSIFRDNYPI